MCELRWMFVGSFWVGFRDLLAKIARKRCLTSCSQSIVPVPCCLEFHFGNVSSALLGFGSCLARPNPVRTDCLESGARILRCRRYCVTFSLPKPNDNVYLTSAEQKGSKNGLKPTTFLPEATN